MPDSPRLTRHADHDPSLTCRPALGYGLCEIAVRQPGQVPPDHPDAGPIHGYALDFDAEFTITISPADPETP